MDTTTNREQWLLSIAASLRGRFEAAGFPLPPADKLLVSVGFPSRGALSRKRRRIGECWHPKTTAAGVHTILVSPVLDDYEAADTLAHELAHAATPGAAHRGPFVRCCKAVGLTEGKPTNASAGEDLAAELRRIMEEVGPYPHHKLNADGLPPKQGTRLLKAECLSCGYVARITQKWIATGLPSCPCGGGELSV